MWNLNRSYSLPSTSYPRQDTTHRMALPYTAAQSRSKYCRIQKKLCNTAHYTTYSWDWAILHALQSTEQLICYTVLHCTAQCSKQDTRLFRVLHSKILNRVQGHGIRLFTVHCSTVLASGSRIQESPRWISALVPPISPTCYYPTWVAIIIMITMVMIKILMIMILMVVMVTQKKKPLAKFGRPEKTLKVVKNINKVNFCLKY